MVAIEATWDSVISERDEYICEVVLMKCYEHFYKYENRHCLWASTSFFTMLSTVTEHWYRIIFSSLMSLMRGAVVEW